MIELILNLLFPPQLGFVEPFGGITQRPEGDFVPVEGSIGEVKPRPYRDAIDRHWRLLAEEETSSNTTPNYDAIQTVNCSFCNSRNGRSHRTSSTSPRLNAHAFAVNE